LDKPNRPFPTSLFAVLAERNSFCHKKMKKAILKTLNHQLLQVIETSGNDELKTELLPFIKRSLDSTVINLLQK